MEKQKARARNAAAVETGDWITLREGETEFVGYDYSEYECHILRYRKITQKKQTFYQIVLDYTPFYGEMGGQVGECGVICSEFETIDIVDAKHENGMTVHIANKLPEHPDDNRGWVTAEYSLLPSATNTRCQRERSKVSGRTHEIQRLIGRSLRACVDLEKRAASAANHSATHLLDAALRQVLGTHVEQKGSFVSPETLRFDFSHFQKVTDEELRQVERIVNEKIRANIPLQEHRDTPLEEAKKMGAIALFGEKYGDKVRVVQFADSVEFCGGIHVKSTGHIGMFKIVSESSVAAGVRRIEAITGKKLEDLLYTMEDTIKGIRALFNNAPDLMGAMQRYINEHDDMKKEIEKFQAQAVENMKNQLVAHAESHNGVKIVKAVLPIAANAAKDLVFKVREAIPENLFCVIGSTENGRPLISVMISDDLVKSHELNAGALVREAGKLIQGGGGGQPHYATAGGKNADGLTAAVDKVLELAKL